MADLTEVAINAALLAELAAFAAAQSPPIAVSYPDVDFTPPAARPPNRFAYYLRAQIFPVDPSAIGIPNDSWNRFEGIFQIDVFYAIGAGSLEPRRVAALVAQHFARGKSMVRDGVEVKVYQPPSISDGITSGAWVMTPVRVRYLTFVKP